LGFHTFLVLPGNLGLIDLRNFGGFGPTAAGGARAAADAALALVAGTDALIFDLRDNGGGSPAMVGYLVGHFVPPGADIYNTFKGRGADTSERPTVAIAPAARRLTVPLYVLISARTGSAAEAFAYTLQAARRATIVGEASGGAANPGELARVGDGFTVFISDGRPVNPITKTNWEGTGVIPDVAVPAADALVRAQALALSGLIKAGLPEPFATEDRWALEALADPPPLSAQQLTGYAGGYGARTVAVEDGRLVIRNGRRPPAVLRPVSPDAFTVEGAPFPYRIRF
jgi:C-terminal processing protease CtpA/Prc